MPTTLPPPVVLIVEDEPDLRDVLEETLQGAGYTARVACHGEEALTYLHAFPGEASVVLLDLAMPVLDGYGLLSRMASEHIDVPVIIMTASRNRVLPPGTRQLQKPFTSSDLIAAIRAECASRTALTGS